LILEAMRVLLRFLLGLVLPTSLRRFSLRRFSLPPSEQELLLLDLETYPSTCAQQVLQQLMMQN
jgi:hypothetical protein